MATKRGQKSGSEASASNGKAPTPSPANAWARPLKTSGPPPGMGPADKTRAPAAGKSTPTKNNKSNGAAIANIHRERLLHLSLTMIGQKVVATLTDGTQLEGIFHTFTPFDGLATDMKNKYVLNAVKVVKDGSKNTVKDGSTVILSVEKVVHLHAKNVNLDRPQNGGTYAASAKGGDVMTDTQISGTKGGKNRDLVAAGSAWTNNSGGKQSRAESLAGGLEETKGTRKGFGTAIKGGETSGLQGNIGKWDQFKANEELFNVNASFDENLYTTELDKSQIDKRKLAEAERIAREIENTTSSNIHVAEERGHAVETDYDEEDRYSGVLTKEGKQRHETPEKASSAAPKKMNYAAAAAKADPVKKTGPSGLAGTKGSDLKAENATDSTPAQKNEATQAAKSGKGESTTESKSDEKAVDKSKSAKPVVESKTTKANSPKKDDKEKSGENAETTKSTKLNANAKSFTFNPSAKSFTPSFGGASITTGPSYTAPQQQAQHMPEPNMQMHPGGHPMQQPTHYMHAAPMGQPGMMPMMNPQYAGMRYPPQFSGVDQLGNPQMQAQPQPQHAQGAPAPSPGQPPSSGTPAPVVHGSEPPASGEGEKPAPQTQDGESSQAGAPAQQQGQPSQQGQQPPQQQGMPMPYNVPPQGAYFAGGGMAMHPRGPGYPPQFVGAPQQIPGGAPFRQMYQMQPGSMPPNMHMRGPGGAPYYPGPNGPMPYPPNAYGHGMMEDGEGGYRGGRGRGRPGGRGRGRSGGRGRGRGNYQNQNQNYGGHQSGRSTPQQQYAPPADGNAPPVSETSVQGDKPKEEASS